MNRRRPPSLWPHSSEERWILGIGTAVGIFFLVVPLIRFLLHPLVTLFHELGHAIVFWAFGYPAIPSFDFMWGGGVTMALERSTFLALSIPLVLAAVLYHWRQQGRSITGAAALLAIYGLLSVSSGHLTLVAFAGHLTTLCLAGVFLFRGRTGVASTSEIEQTLYIACGIYVYVAELSFAWGLWTSEEARSDYRHSPKGINDLIEVSRDFGFELEATAFLYLLLCLLAPLVLARWIRSHGAGSVAELDDPGLTEPEPLPDIWQRPDNRQR